MKWDVFIKWGCAIVGAVVGTVQDSWSGVLTFLLILNIMDYVTGVVCAMVGKSSKTVGGSLSSAVGFTGIAKKFFIWAIIILATCVDRFVIGNGTTVQSAAAMFYAANEALSVIENCALIGLPVPAFLRTMLEVMRDKNDNGGKDGTSGTMERLDPVGVHQDRRTDGGLGADPSQTGSGMDEQEDAL